MLTDDQKRDLASKPSLSYYENGPGGTRRRAKAATKVRTFKDYPAKNDPDKAERHAPEPPDPETEADRELRLKTLKETGAPVMPEDMVDATIYAVKELRSKNSRHRKDAMKFVGDAFRSVRRLGGGGGGGAPLTEVQMETAILDVEKAYLAEERGADPVKLHELEVLSAATTKRIVEDVAATEKSVHQVLGTRDGLGI